MACVQHLAVQGNHLVPDSVPCLSFFILLSYILVSEASLMSCKKKDWESPELPSWNDGLYPFTRKLRDVIISLILPLLFWQVSCAAFEQKGMERFQWYRSFECKVLFMHDITATLEKVWGALRVTHTLMKKKIMNGKESRNWH